MDIKKLIFLSVTSGIIISIFTIFIKSCGEDLGGVKCEYISDIIFGHGFPLTYYSTGGIQGIRYFHAILFVVDVVIWSLLIFLAITIINRIRKYK